MILIWNENQAHFVPFLQILSRIEKISENEHVVERKANVMTTAIVDQSTSYRS